MITGNTASMTGGGMYYGSSSNPTIQDCTIRDNSPDGVWIGALSEAQILGTVHVISNNLKGAGVFQIVSDATLEIVDSGVSCNMAGTGTVYVPAGRECVIEDFAIVDLGALNDPNTTGTVQCDGFLRVRDYANVTLSRINVVLASFEGNVVISENIISTTTDTPYGQIAVRDTAVIVENVFQSSGDRFIDVDSSTFEGVLLNNRIIVTITEGRNNTPPALFDLRGEDTFCYEPTCPPGLYPLEEIPDFEPNTWTVERWELLENAKATLTNRFDFQPPYDANGGEETLYIKHLVLGPNSFLNIGFNRVYYETLEMGPGAVIREVPPMGFYLDGVGLDREVEYLTRVRNNNVYGPTPRMFVERVEGVQPDTTGMMRMRNLPGLDPCSPVVNARAKTVLAKSSEGEILIRFKYLFETSDPNAELAVYVSDVPYLMAHNDPNWTEHNVKIADIPHPANGQAGSAGSGRFGVFQMTVSTEELNFVEGMWLEVELIEPASGAPLAATGMENELSSGSNGALIDDWGVEVHCDGICMDVNWDTIVSEEDFLTVIAACGLPASLDPNAIDSLVCLDGFFSNDGFLDAMDVVSWDWAVDSGDAFPLYCGVPLAKGMETASAAAVDFEGPGGLSSYVSLPGSLDDLLIAGKRGTSGDPYELKSKDRLYVFDNNNVCMGWSAPESDRCNIKLVRDLEGKLYQLNSIEGVLRLDDTNEVIIPPGKISDINEPRNGGPAAVYVGLQGVGENATGRPILDAVVDANYVYVVPVVVEPNDPNVEPYAAAAKLKLLEAGNPPYQLIQLYDETPPHGDNKYRNNLREIELDAAGNVYVVNAHSLNESDTLWKYEPNGTMIKSLNLGNPNGVYIPDPLGLCVSNTTEMLYLASGQYNPADINSTVVHGVSLKNLTPQRSITIGGMQHVSSITEDPKSGTLWIAGFNMVSFPQWPDPTLAPFYRPSLAKVPYNSNAVQAVSIYDPNSHDLALPVSIVWTRPVKCGGADLDGDGYVTFADFAVPGLAWLSRLGDPNWNPDCNISIPADAFIDSRDLAIFVEHWLETGCL
jgi:parallel beta-helix repeat protein